jgi:hypothetical protein
MRAPKSLRRPAGFRRRAASLKLLLAALALMALAQCAGGYDGPPEPFLNGDRSHGKP